MKINYFHEYLDLADQILKEAEDVRILKIRLDQLMDECDEKYIPSDVLGELSEAAEKLNRLGGFLSSYLENSRSYLSAVVASGENFVPSVKTDLRKWWHEILRSYGRYYCYGVFLFLPSDKEIIHYLTEFGKELHLISGDKCLMLALGKSYLQQIDFEKKEWDFAVQEQANEGYSLRIAEAFDISIAEMPCFLLFKDIRSPEHIILSLKNTSKKEIAIAIRLLVSEINDAFIKGADLLSYIERHRDHEKFMKAGKSILSELRRIAGTALESAFESVIKSTL